jgi:hypothetical protein
MLLHHALDTCAGIESDSISLGLDMSIYYLVTLQYVPTMLLTTPDIRDILQPPTNPA